MNSTKIKFSLKKGSQLFINYRETNVLGKDLNIYSVKNDTSFVLEIKAEKPFTLVNLNKQNTQYLIINETDYNVEVKKGQIDLFFKCKDNYKQNECNVLNLMEKTFGKQNLSEEDKNKVFNNLIKEKIYSRALDSFFTLRINERIKFLEKLKLEDKISLAGFKILKKYINFSFIGNRFLPFSYYGFEKTNFPQWYVDTILNHSKEFNDTTLINTIPYRRSLRYLNLFLSKQNKSKIGIENEFEVAKTFSDIGVVNDLMLFQIFTDNSNKKQNIFTKYIDSLKLYCKNDEYKLRIIQNNDFTQILSNGKNTLINLNNTTFNLDSIFFKNKKVVIVDFWATWCAPCIKELSTIKNLINELDLQKINYVFVSMDEDYVKWKNAIKSYPFMNIHNSFILKNNFDSDFAKLKAIKTIPYYIIYEANGALAKSGIENVQTQEFKNYLKKLLIK